MGAQTEVLKLYMPGGGSLGIGGADEVLDVDKLNQNSQKIDDFAKGWGTPDERNQQFYGLAAGRSLLTGMKHGDTYQESDGDKRLWRFDGINWQRVQTVVNLASTGALPVSSQGGIGPSRVDVTGMTVTFTLTKDTLCRFFATVNTYSSAVGDAVVMSVTNGTLAVDATYPANSANLSATTHVRSQVLELKVPAGTHTFKIQVARAAGTGNVTVLSQGSAPNSLSVDAIL